MKTVKVTIEQVQNGYILDCGTFKKVANTYERIIECLAESLESAIPNPSKPVMELTISVKEYEG